MLARCQSLANVSVNLHKENIRSVLFGVEPKSGSVPGVVGVKALSQPVQKNEEYSVLEKREISLGGVQYTVRVFIQTVCMWVCVCVNSVEPCWDNSQLFPGP